MFGLGMTPRFRWLVALPSILLVATVVSFSARGEDSTEKPAAEPKTLRELLDVSMNWYEVFSDSETKEPAKVLPVLRWANNARGSEDGVTLLFVHDGIPLAVACVYPWSQRLIHEFESLSRRKIVARREGVVVWQPQEPGVKFVDIPGAPVPEVTRPARLRQMKVLAERFQATMTGWKADSTDREELRLLPRPLFRYEPKAGDVIDGAVFAFVTGTDPEVLLQIEAVKTGGKTTWQYAFSRRTSGRLEGRLDHAVVWNAERFPVNSDPRQPHFSRGVPLPPEIAIEQAKLQEATP